jgi:hypothetical protein
VGRFKVFVLRCYIVLCHTSSFSDSFFLRPLAMVMVLMCECRYCRFSEKIGRPFRMDLFQ